MKSKYFVFLIGLYIYLSAVDVLDRALPEEKVDELLCLEGAHEVGLAEPHTVVLTGAQRVNVSETARNDGVGAGKVGGGRGEETTARGHQRGAVGVRRIRTLGDAGHCLQHLVDVPNLESGKITCNR